MEINSQMNLGNPIKLNDDGISLSSFTKVGQPQQGKIQSQFTQQFQQAAKLASEELENSQTQSEISQRKEDGTKEVVQKNYSSLQKMDDLKVVPDIITEVPDDMIEDLLENNTGLKKLEKQQKETNELLEKKLIGEKSSTGLRSLISSTNISIFSKWLKELSKKKKDIDDTEGIATDKASDTQKTKKTAPSGKKTSSENISKQQKLFTLNLRSSIRFLKNMKNLSKRFFPELIIYEDETGYVDSEKTLECLGWQNVSQYQQTLFNQLTNESLNNISHFQKVLNVAKENGIGLYKGTHPVFSKNENILAVEQLTGELTILKDLIELQKLQLDDNVLTCQQVSDR
ncbi:MAG: hypothetical protein A2Y40_10115 [Candidatus Margulisbacteria bacterium GWF2_35_9]|nr:MAG: hypothetical protein A2Y40_10115 [Candidatus Margulisbacteria bacterium GWF2_35_9]